MELLWVLKEHHLLPMLVLVMRISMVESMSDNNLCHRVENYTETVREMYEEPVVVQAFTWCLSIPPRCRKSYTEIRTRYRIKSQQKQRNVSECCPGFVEREFLIGDEFIKKCIPIYKCKSGYTGENCDIECPEGTWGAQCMQMCDCSVHATCNPINGTCNCLPGWHGKQCEKKCDADTWGLNCANLCSCFNIFIHSNVYCHHVSGVCLPGKAEPIDKPPSSGMSNLLNDETLETSSSSHSPIYLTETTSVNSIRSTSIVNTTSNSHDIVNDNYLEMPITKKIYSASNVTVHDKVTSNTTLKTTSIDKRKFTTNGKLYAVEMENSTSIKPIVTVVHVSGKSILGHENVILTPINNSDSSGNGSENDTEHTQVPLHIAALLLIGSTLLLILTTLAVLVIFDKCSRLYDTIKLAIHDAEKPDPRTNIILSREKTNDNKISTLNRNIELFTPSCDYETPRCIVSEQRNTTLPRAHSVITRESTCSNQYSNIQLYSNLRELLEANYDRPPATATTFHQSTIDIDVEHLYDEISLQSTTFATKNQD